MNMDTALLVCIVLIVVLVPLVIRRRIKEYQECFGTTQAKEETSEKNVH